MTKTPDTAPARGDGHRFSISRLMLSDFRSYHSLRLETDSRSVVLTGPNGAGKTNLLEAISFLGPGRGLRRARLSEVARRDGPDDKDDGEAPSFRPWAVAVEVKTPQGRVEIGTGLEAQLRPGAREKRAVHVDGEARKSQAALAEHLSVQWLTPQMDRLFLEGPSARRRFLDRLVFGFDPAHAGRVSAYEHAMRERGRLLRRGPADADWLRTLEETMAEKGIAVAAARQEITHRLDAVCGRPQGPFPGARLQVLGPVEDWLAEGPALAAEDRLKERLRGARDKDREAGGASFGPHRSDFAVRHLAKDQPAGQCSTGEQKALLITIVLATARMLAETRGTPPLLLLDEVAAHLDQDRRRALYDEVSALGAQAWLTGTDAALFDSLGSRAQHFEVRDGILTPRSA
ncbi:MAG: DNA replication/repair protein RecF [Rhodospirillales bacterium]|nr:DNA replication/repair protein RecF [Rhodospirillales bacterium]